MGTENKKCDGKKHSVLHAPLNWILFLLSALEIIVSPSTGGAGPSTLEAVQANAILLMGLID